MSELHRILSRAESKERIKTFEMGTFRINFNKGLSLEAA